MLNEYFDEIPCGATLPLNNPYACSVSMPKLQDVIDYEEEKNGIFDKIKSGYPRIIFNPYNIRFLEYFKKRNQIGDSKKLFLLPSVNSLKIMSTLVKGKVDVYFHKELVIAAIDKTNKKLVDDFYAFLKHTGYTVFARRAEDVINSVGITTENKEEEIIIEDPEEKIIDELSRAYEIEDKRNVIISSSGMNSIFSVYLALKEEQLKKNRSVFIQYGWLYTDSIQLLKKLSKECKIITDVSNTDELEKYLEDKGNKVAGILTESISNPLIKTPDLPKVKSLAQKYDIPILLDNTFATPFNTNAHKYCDIIFESLTKFACGFGDVLMGAAVLSNNSIVSKEVFDKSKFYIEPAYKRDLQRLAYEIVGYQERIKKINANTKELVEYLENHARVKKVYHVFDDPNISNYEKISNNRTSYGGVISVLFKDDFQTVYDKIKLPKGPSLGTNFTLLMPYTMLAHYDLVTSEEGKKYLDEIGLSPDLLRISVGLEPIEQLINQFEDALK